MRLEQAYQHFMRQSYRNANATYTLPVVIHIIHKGGSENISDLQVYQALDNLNAAFQNQGYYDPDTGEDMQIEFCLAQRDTAGQATTGILRYQSPIADMSSSYDHADVAALATWNTNEYINIRVVKEACVSGNCDPVGYAYLPPLHGWSGDGLVVEAAYFGPEPENTTTLVHEMGHYLGLLHTFAGGCANSDCLATGDGVCDTPPDNATGAFPCELSFNSCTTDADDSSLNNPFREVALGGLGDQPDMHQNYMDYGYHHCRDRFTAGQRDRMHFFIENARQSLLEARSCLPPCSLPPTALFMLNQDSIEAGQSLIPINLSNNASSYKWYLNDSLVSQTNDPIISVEGEGIYILRLEAESLIPECEPAVYELTLNVYCTLEANFDYNINGNTLQLNSWLTDVDSLMWEVRDVGNNLIFSTAQPTISIDVSGLSFVQACLTVIDDFCFSRNCQYINLTPDGAEICNNYLDDDADGLVDAFDPDCPCNDGQYQAYCPIACEYLPDSFPDLEMQVEWTSEITSNIPDLAVILPICMVGDINNDGLVDVLTKSSTGVLYGPGDSNNAVENQMLVLNGENGATQLGFNYDERNNPNTQAFAIADVDSDNNTEIFTLVGDSIFCYNNNGVLIWKSDNLSPNFSTIGFNFADFNNDGIVELYTDNKIINASTGTLLAQGSAGAGCNFTGAFGLCLITHSVAADLLPSSGLELAAGNTVYQVEINNTSGTAGNIMTPILAPAEVPDGNTSVGDIDGDGMLDVVVVRTSEEVNGQGGVYVWDPRTQTVLASAASGIHGGVAFIGDVTGDCRPEIGMNFSYELRMYEYDGSSNLQLLYSLPTSDGSGRTGVTMFDFNQDGQQELVYRDETHLRILEGATGLTYTSFPMRSGTAFEYPVIADVDQDGEAEILIEGYQEIDADGNRDLRLYCFGSAGTPWAPARSVWNQYAYNVTNVNDDLTIPRYPQSPAATLEGYENCLRPTCPAPYNTFLAQATYRTQEGCVQFPAADLYLDILSYSCTPDSFSVCAVVGNIGSRPITESITIACYESDPRSSIQEVIDLVTITLSDVETDTLQADTICITSPQFVGLDSFYLSINDIGGVFPSSADIVECNYNNNIDGIALDYNEKNLDLGTDVIKCESEVLTLNAGSDFDSYLWNDGTIDSLYSSSAEGWHFVTTTDHCGRVYSDSVYFTLDHTEDIDLGADLVFCQGDSVTIAINEAYDFIHWLPTGLINCDTCHSISFLANSSITIVVIAGRANCYSADTLDVSVKEPYIFSSSYTICEGDSLIHHGVLLTEPGEYELPFASCDSLEVVQLTVIPHQASRDTITLCQGDSIFILNQWIDSSIIISESYPASNGCDSTQHYVVEVTDLSNTSLSYELCEGDSLFFGGEWLIGGGVHDVIVSVDTGCDSLY
ncbi:MAG: hypothetical protein MI974_13680, partial [Chitinophagales bacterium]|nr:hypothetical protein [Chitinophagales bacterium]